jgi:CheY-like chemotaxis protein
MDRAAILVIDDEPLFVAVFRRLLADYDVTGATDPCEALRSIEAGNRFDAILSDVDMPALRGDELHAALVRVAPDQAERMIFVSGGLDDAAQTYFATLPNPCLAKPVDPQQLLALVAERVAASRAQRER